MTIPFNEVWRRIQESNMAKEEAYVEANPDKPFPGPLELAAKTRNVPVVISTAEQWREYHGGYPQPPCELTEPQPVCVFAVQGPVGYTVPVGGQYEPDPNEPEEPAR